MAKETNTTRIQMTFPSALIDSIDAYCKKLHIPRTAWIQTTLAQSIYSAEKMYAAGADAIAGTVADFAKKDDPSAEA